MADNQQKTETNLSFKDTGLVDYGEDWEKILPYFFFNFYPNSNANVDLKTGERQSDFSITIKDQAKDIENALRLAARFLDSENKLTSADRDIMQAWQIIKNVLNEDIEPLVSRF